MKISHISRLALGALLLSQLCSAQPQWPPDTFSCYYGGITPEAVEALKDIDLLVVHPGDEEANLNAQKVELLKKTGKEKTVVGYVTIGEDDRPPGGPPIKGEDDSGPSFVDPETLEVKTANAGYPTRFLDQQKIEMGENGFIKFGPDGTPVMTSGQDGHPDENGVWGSFYVRTDDPEWQATVFKKMDSLVEMGADGFFLDTVDTASPWGDYGWTSSAMLEFVEAIHKRYPGKKVIGNRGLFYLSKNDRYAKALDAVLFESVLTNYNWEANVGDISPWAKWHVKALDEEVRASTKRTGLHLLVLDYLNPKQDDALVLIQSDRTLLKDIPHSLSFSHPALQIPGWTSADLLKEPAPAAWPTLKDIKVKESAPGRFTLTATFDSEVPKEALPDLRVTTRDDVQPRLAAQLPPAQLLDWKANGNTLTLEASGLDKNTTYRAFLRLISGSDTPQSDFGWTQFQTAASELPSQVKELSSSNQADGLMLNFTADSMVAEKYRVYKFENNEAKLLLETSESPATLKDLEVGDTFKVFVVAVTADGQEGYPSELHGIIRKDVVPPNPPGIVQMEQEGSTVTFWWDEAPGAEKYRLYTVPEGQSLRLPHITEETEAEFQNVVPGKYRVFITAVDDAGNQSLPGLVTEVEIR